MSFSMVIVVFVHEITVEMCMHRVIGGISNGEADELKLEISFIASNEVARVRIVEGPHLKPRWENSDVLIPFLMVPRSSFDFCSNCLNCLGALISDPLGVNRTC